ncbi:hypothetical protein HAX54_021028, partial [Datura stramonium]|nr:hypothetical protein [Datura stramonium]
VVKVRGKLNVQLSRATAKKVLLRRKFRRSETAAAIKRSLQRWPNLMSRSVST